MGSVGATLDGVIREFESPMSYGCGPDVKVTIERAGETRKGDLRWKIRYELLLLGETDFILSRKMAREEKVADYIEGLADSLKEVMQDIAERAEEARKHWYPKLEGHDAVRKQTDHHDAGHPGDLHGRARWEAEGAPGAHPGSSEAQPPGES